MIEQKILSVFLTKEFRELWEDYVTMVDENPRFKEMLKNIKTKTGKRDKRIKKSKRDSLRVRFAILICLEQLIKEQEVTEEIQASEEAPSQLNNIIEENASTQTVSEEEVLS